MKHLPFLTGYGYILVVLGIVIRFWIRQRRFKRRNMAGLQTFTSYGNSLIVRFFERILMLVSLVLICVGIYILLGRYLF